MDAAIESLGETLIPIVSKLQEILHGVDLPEDGSIQLPEVAVVGSQSSGKSSVLESLVGRDFLPRGPDICTRRPLVLHLRRVSHETGGSQEWAEFPAHLPGKRFVDFADVRDEIDAETARLLGSRDKDISATPIHLKIHSPHVLTMSLVDLPGMTRVPVKGQPEDIAAKLEGLIKQYISNPSCIILAVSAANSDLANSDAIALARAVDPDGRRTIGVLTKLDIMDRGTDALRMLRNEVLPLRLGYIAVVNRSQADIRGAVPVSRARANEAAFFSANPSYRSVAAQCGVPALSRRIQAILVRHIQRRLPELREEIEAREKLHREELIALGTAAASASAEAARAALLRLLGEYAAAFSGALHGRPRELEEVRCTLLGGARIRHVFQDIFAAALDELDPCAGLDDDQIFTVMNNCAGVSKPLIVAKEAFEVLVRKALQQLENPGRQCLSMVTKELLRITEECLPSEASRFPTLYERLNVLVHGFVSAAHKRADSMLSALFECELAYINADHPSFIGMRAAWQELFERRDPVEGSSSGTGASAANGLVKHSRGSNTSLSRGRAAVTQPRHHAALAVPDQGHRSGSPSTSGGEGTNAIEPPEETEPSGWLTSLFPGRRPLLEGRGAEEVRPASPSRSAPAAAPASQYGFASVLASQPAPSGMHGGPFLPSAPPTLVTRVLGQQDRDSVAVMRKLIRSYFKVVQGTMKDMVPKVVMRFVVLHIEQELHRELISALLNGDELSMMRERPEVSQRRKSLSKAVGVLNEAIQQLQQIPQELEGRVDSLHLGEILSMGPDHAAPASRADAAVDPKSVAERSMHMYRSLALSSVGAHVPEAAAAEAAAARATAALTGA